MKLFIMILYSGIWFHRVTMPDKWRSSSNCDVSILKSFAAGGRHGELQPRRSSSIPVGAGIACARLPTLYIGPYQKHGAAPKQGLVSWHTLCLYVLQLYTLHLQQDTTPDTPTLSVRVFIVPSMWAILSSPSNHPSNHTGLSGLCWGWIRCVWILSWRGNK